MNKSAIATILATAALSVAKKASGSQNRYITVHTLDKLIRHANDPQLAPLVTKVRIYDEFLTKMPPEIGNLKNLEELYLTGHAFTSIPKEIGNLTNLKYLNLEENQITSIPPEIWNLTNLKHLCLFSNQITSSIPPEIGNLKNLEKLYLSNNQIKSIPSEICNLTNLEEISLPWVKIPPSQIRKMIQNGYAINPIIMKELMHCVDTNPTSPIRRF